MLESSLESDIYFRLWRWFIIDIWS